MGYNWKWETFIIKNTKCFEVNANILCHNFVLPSVIITKRPRLVFQLVCRMHSSLLDQWKLNGQARTGSILDIFLEVTWKLTETLDPQNGFCFNQFCLFYSWKSKSTKEHFGLKWWGFIFKYKNAVQYNAYHPLQWPPGGACPGRGGVCPGSVCPGGCIPACTEADTPLPSVWPGGCIPACTETDTAPR